MTGRLAPNPLFVIASPSACGLAAALRVNYAKQSRGGVRCHLDCFAALAMTKEGNSAESGGMVPNGGVVAALGVGAERGGAGGLLNGERRTTA